jgi:NAD(P)-dependent dehydrogenase (short-subunit alcohol dehydrogenase family)
MNNAGVAGGGDALSNPDGWTRVLDVNFFGILHGVQAFVPAMADSGERGLVINTGSKQGITQPPGDTAYNVSKSAVKALTEGLAHTLRNRPGCKVTAHLLIPGFTYTGMIARRVAERPPGAWTPEQVVDRLVAGVAADEFYVLCQDNETTREQDDKRILWAARDIIESRPALSRWHPDWKDAFERFMAG